MFDIVVLLVFLSRIVYFLSRIVFKSYCFFLFFLSGIDGIFKLHCAFLSRIVGDFLSRINGIFKWD